MLEFALPFRIRTERMTRGSFPLGLQGEHFAGVIEDGSGGVSFCARPSCVAKRTERRRFLADAHVTRDQIRLLERDINFRLVRELEDEHLLLFSALGRA